MAEEHAHGDGDQQPEVFPPVPKHRKKKHKHASHGGAWKVAYADFITTMMALFLLLWLLTAADQSTKNIIALYFKDPGIFDNAQGNNVMSGAGSSKKAQAVPITEVVGPGKAGQGGSENTVTMQDVESALKRALHNVGPYKGGEQQVLFSPVDNGLLIQIVDSGDKPLFPPGRTNPLPQAQLIIEQLGFILALLPDFELSISGHTDSRPFPPGTIYTNWDLSLDRAQEASKILMQSGVPVKRIKSVAGYADSRPVDPDNPFDPRNRRISILLKRTTATILPGHIEAFQAGPEKAPPEDVELPLPPGAAGGGAEGGAAPAGAAPAGGAPAASPGGEAQHGDDHGAGGGH